MTNISEKIYENISQFLRTNMVKLEDFSNEHSGHAGIESLGNETHFKITVISDSFIGKSKVDRHKLVYAAITPLFQQGLHAVEINVFTMHEYQQIPGKNIAVIGAGYVGLVTACGLCEIGHNVTCIEVDTTKVHELSKGEVRIMEPGLKELLLKHIANGNIRFTNNYEALQAEGFIIAVPTPSNSNGSTDMSYVNEALDKLINAVGRAEKAHNKKYIIIKSTVSVGTAFAVCEKLKSLGLDENFEVISNPEFLREGFAVRDFMEPDRVVIGHSSRFAKNFMWDLYFCFVKNGIEILYMNNTSAELVKYAANAYLACRITFINEIANLCEKTGANIEDVRIGIGSDNRIGNTYLYPGVGFGGSCLPKDTKSLLHVATSNGVKLGIVEAAVLNNDARIDYDIPSRIIERVPSGAKICLLGLTFKAKTNDLRDSPAIRIAMKLKEAGFILSAYDPGLISFEIDNKYIDFLDEKCNNPYDAARSASAVVVLTEWQEFLDIDFVRLRENMELLIFMDFRNLFTKIDVRSYGFEYIPIGVKL